MSSLIFCIGQDEVLVATDTLATWLDGRPFMFTSKAFILPHLKMIIAGTGAGGFLGRWFVEVNDRMVVPGIQNLNAHTPHALAAIWTGYKEQVRFPEERTTTVYHFGFSEVSGFIHSYAYRSDCGFASERLRHGLHVKPQCTIPSAYCLPEDIKVMMREQRVIQASEPEAKRVYIGGEIQIFHLMRAGFNVYTLDKFEDFDTDQKAIYRNFQAEN